MAILSKQRSFDTLYKLVLVGLQLAAMVVAADEKFEGTMDQVANNLMTSDVLPRVARQKLAFGPVRSGFCFAALFLGGLANYSLRACKDVPTFYISTGLFLLLVVLAAYEALSGHYFASIFWLALTTGPTMMAGLIASQKVELLNAVFYRPDASIDSNHDPTIMTLLTEMETLLKKRPLSIDDFLSKYASLKAALVGAPSLRPADNALFLENLSKMTSFIKSQLATASMADLNKINTAVKDDKYSTMHVTPASGRSANDPVFKDVLVELHNAIALAELGSLVTPLNAANALETKPLNELLTLKTEITTKMGGYSTGAAADAPSSKVTAKNVIDAIASKVKKLAAVPEFDDGNTAAIVDKYNEVLQTHKVLSDHKDANADADFDAEITALKTAVDTKWPQAKAAAAVTQSMLKAHEDFGKAPHTAAHIEAGTFDQFVATASMLLDAVPHGSSLESVKAGPGAIPNGAALYELYKDLAIVRQAALDKISNLKKKAEQDPSSATEILSEPNKAASQLVAGLMTLDALQHDRDTGSMAKVFNIPSSVFDPSSPTGLDIRERAQKVALQQALMAAPKAAKIPGSTADHDNTIAIYKEAFQVLEKPMKDANAVLEDLTVPESAFVDPAKSLATTLGTLKKAAEAYASRLASTPPRADDASVDAVNSVLNVKALVDARTGLPSLTCTHISKASPGDSYFKDVVTKLDDDFLKKMPVTSRALRTNDKLMNRLTIPDNAPAGIDAVKDLGSLMQIFKKVDDKVAANKATLTTEMKRKCLAFIAHMQAIVDALKREVFDQASATEQNAASVDAYIAAIPTNGHTYGTYGETDPSKKDVPLFNGHSDELKTLSANIRKAVSIFSAIQGLNRAGKTVADLKRSLPACFKAAVDTLPATGLPRAVGTDNSLQQAYQLLDKKITALKANVTEAVKSAADAEKQELKAVLQNLKVGLIDPTKAAEDFFDEALKQ